MSCIGQLETTLSLPYAQGTLPHKLITGYSCARDEDPKQPSQLQETIVHVSALAATWRVKPGFKPRL